VSHPRSVLFYFAQLCGQPGSSCEKTSSPCGWVIVMEMTCFGSVVKLIDVVGDGSRLGV